MHGCHGGEATARLVVQGLGGTSSRPTAADNVRWGWRPRGEATARLVIQRLGRSPARLAAEACAPCQPAGGGELWSQCSSDGGSKQVNCWSSSRHTPLGVLAHRTSVRVALQS